jgi:hypothetical protein
MAFRFQRRIKLAPGLHLNLSKSGVGFSAGGRGFYVGIDSRKRPYATTGIPGTGISWREYSKTQPGHESASSSGGGVLLVLVVLILIIIAAVIGKK